MESEICTIQMISSERNYCANSFHHAITKLRSIKYFGDIIPLIRWLIINKMYTKLKLLNRFLIDWEYRLTVVNQCITFYGVHLMWYDKNNNGWWNSMIIQSTKCIDDAIFAIEEFRRPK